MTFELTSAQVAFIQQAVANGCFARAEDAVTEALLLWEERERHRSEFLASLDEAEASLDRGEGIPIPPGLHAVVGRRREAPWPRTPRRRAASAAELTAHRVGVRARADLDEIWAYVVRETGSEANADRHMDTITTRFSLLGGTPVGRGPTEFPSGRLRDRVQHCRCGCRILRVVHGRRNLAALFGP